MNQDNPYRAYWEKAQEKSLKLAQYYTPECLVELCIALLQPKEELFDPCCGLGSFLLKAKEKDNSLKISGNDIATDLGELPFEFTNSDYLNNGEDKQIDYIIANIPFNLKKTHCNLVNENYCWIEKIIRNTRKKALIILPNAINSEYKKKLIEKRKSIIESGVIELVCQLPPNLFNKTAIAPTFWLIDKEKVNKDIYFLHAEKFSKIEDRKKRTLTAENIKDICNKENWNLVSYDKIKEGESPLAPRFWEKKPEVKPKTRAEVNRELFRKVCELRSYLHCQIADAYFKLKNLDEVESDNPNIFEIPPEFYEHQKFQALHRQIQNLWLGKLWADD